MREGGYTREGGERSAREHGLSGGVANPEERRVSRCISLVNARHGRDKQP